MNTTNEARPAAVGEALRAVIQREIRYITGGCADLKSGDESLVERLTAALASQPQAAVAQEAVACRSCYEAAPYHQPECPRTSRSAPESQPQAALAGGDATSLRFALQSIVDWIDEGGEGAIYTIERCARNALAAAPAPAVDRVDVALMRATIDSLRTRLASCEAALQAAHAAPAVGQGIGRPCKVGGPCVAGASGPCACRELPAEAPLTPKPAPEDTRQAQGVEADAGHLLRIANRIHRTIREAYFAGHYQPVETLRDALLNIDNSLMHLREYQQAQDRIARVQMTLDAARTANQEPKA